MTDLHVIPTVDTVARLFNDLLGRRVVVKRNMARQQVLAGTAGAYGLYGSADDQVEALVFFDMALACYAGAALALIPVSTVQPGVRTGSMTSATFENLSEILNIARSWFDTATAPQFKLLKCIASPCVLAKDAAALLQKWTARLDLEVEITGYGAGKLLIVVK
jgi:hypothetical protein